MQNTQIILNGKYRRVFRDGREYFVAPMTIFVPGVLNGSHGPLYYPPEVVKDNPKIWNGVPLLKDHPYRESGNPQKASQVLGSQGIGFVKNTKFRGEKLAAEGWFDIKRVQKIDNRIYQALERGEKIELSTGLVGRSNQVGGKTPDGKVYNATVTKIKPDHIAILMDVPGACSIDDGCGVYNSKKKPISNQASHFDIAAQIGKSLEERFGYQAYLVECFDDYCVYRIGKLLFKLGYTVDKKTDLVTLSNDMPTQVSKMSKYVPVTNAKKSGGNCGTGSGGFKPGNQCAAGGKSMSYIDPKTKKRVKANFVELTGSARLNKKHERWMQIGVTKDLRYVQGWSSLPQGAKVFRMVQNVENECQCESCKKKRKGKRLAQKETYNTRKDKAMLRKSQRAALIEELVENCSLDDDEATALEEFSDEALLNMGKMKKKAKKKPPVEDGEEEEMENSSTPTTTPAATLAIDDDKAAEHLFGKGVTAGDVRGAFKTARDIENRNRTSMIEKLTGHLEGDALKASVENYSKMPTETLEFIANSLPTAPKVEAPKFNFTGAGGSSIENTKPNYDPKDILPVPEMSFPNPFARQA